MLKTLKNEKYQTQKLFIDALYELAAPSLVDRYKSLVLQHTETSGRFNGQSYIEFLAQLLTHYQGKIILIEDGSPYYGSRVVNEFKGCD